MIYRGMVYKGFSAEMLHALNPLEKIEYAGRICYKSEDKTTADSHLAFVKKMVENRHLAMTEHATFIFQYVPQHMFQSDKVRALIEVRDSDTQSVPLFRYTDTFHGNGYMRSLFSCNLRGLNDAAQQGLGFALEMLRAVRNGYGDVVVFEPEVLRRIEEVDRKGYNNEFKITVLPTLSPAATRDEIENHLYMSFIFHCDRGVSHEAVRHRPASFAQESTRYCNYSNDAKFGGDISITLPSDWYTKSDEVKACYERAWKAAEDSYMELTKVHGEKPQQARSVLPQSTKVDMVMTAVLKEWLHFFNNRYFGRTGKPHPDMYAVASDVYRLVGEYLQAYFPYYAEHDFAFK